MKFIPRNYCLPSLFECGRGALGEGRGAGGIADASDAALIDGQLIDQSLRTTIRVTETRRDVTTGHSSANRPAETTVLARCF